MMTNQSSQSQFKVGAVKFVDVACCVFTMANPVNSVHADSTQSSPMADFESISRVCTSFSKY